MEMSEFVGIPRLGVSNLISVQLNGTARIRFSCHQGWASPLSCSEEIGLSYFVLIAGREGKSRRKYRRL